MFHWDVQNINGEDHMVVKDPKLTMRLQRVHFDFENISGVDNEGKRKIYNETISIYINNFL